MAEAGMEKLAIRTYRSGAFREVSADIVREVPFSLYLNGEEIAVIACTGLHLRELAAGYLRSEGFIVSREDLKEIRIVEGREPSCHATAKERRRPKTAAFIGSSGARGKAGGDSGPAPFATAAPDLNPPRVLDLMQQLQAAARIHEATRGTHCSGLADASGMILTREDIGRHNTIDMLGGCMLLENLDGADKTVVTTGRISSEIVAKARRMGVPAIISHSAPTAGAVALCREFGMTLIGYVRNGTFEVYAGFKNRSLEPSSP